MLLTNPDPPQASNPKKTEHPCLRTGNAHPSLKASSAVTPEIIGIASSSSETKPEAALDATGRQGMGMAEQQKEEQKGPAMEQLQEMFGPLVENQLSMMDWAPR